MTQIAELDQYRERRERDGGSRGPQVEDGHTRIANDLLDALCKADFTAREFRVVNFVIRQTYGWNCKAKRMAANFIAAGTELHESDCSKVLNELIRRRVILRHGGSRSPVSLNKHSDEWLASETSKKTPPAKRPESGQDALAQSGQDALTKKDRKDTTTADAVVGRTKTKRQPRIKWSLDSLPDGISAEVAEAYREHRKAKRAKMTDYALSLVIDKASRAADEVGISGDDVLNMAIEGGWTGLEVKWVRRVLSERADQPAAANPDIPACPHADLLAIWDDTCGRVKGSAPNLLDWQGTKSAEALAERWAEFYAVEVNGKVRYDSLESGLDWWRMALETIAGKQDFRNADVDIWSLFYKNRFGRAARGQLCGQGGATR